MTLSPISCTLGALMLLLVPLSVAASEVPPPVSTIIGQAIARDEATKKALHSMEYHQLLKTERLDDQGTVVQQQELRMIVRPGAAQEIQVLSEKGDNLPSNPDDATLQAQGQKAKNQNVDISLKDLADRFKISFVGTDTIRGQPVYVVAFEPKPDQPYRNQTEKVLNHLHGQMWIRARDYTVLKTDATLAEPVEIAWILAQISTLTFHYDLESTSDDLGPARITTVVKVATPFLDITQRITVDLSQFQPRSKP